MTLRANFPVAPGGASGGGGGGGAVSSVFTRTGDVVAATGDYTVAQVTGAAPLASPALTGTPTAPTAAPGTNTTQLATTAFVASLAGALVTGVSSVFGRTGAVVKAAGDYAVADVTGAAPLASPTFTGTPAAPTAVAGTNTTQLATTAFVTTADNLKAPLASPALTGTPTAPTATAGTNTTQLATTAFVTAADNLKANLASPTFTGTPAAPTPATADSSTTLATTAFVKAQAYAPLASPALTGTPTVPTAAWNTNTTQAASTAYVDAARTGGVALAADATAIASTSLTNVPTLVVPVVANGVYVIEWDVDLTIATTTETFGVNVTGPTGATGNYDVVSLNGVPNTGAASARMAANALGTAVASGNFGNPGSATAIVPLRVRATVRVSSTAGNVTLQLNGSTTGNLVVKINSSVVWDRVA